MLVELPKRISAPATRRARVISCQKEDKVMLFDSLTVSAYLYFADDLLLLVGDVFGRSTEVVLDDEVGVLADVELLQEGALDEVAIAESNLREVQVLCRGPE